MDGQYFKISGSLFSDGVYKYPASDLLDEEFSGEVWALAVPSAVVSLSQEIDDWVTVNDAILKSPYTSESFGGYSYSKPAAGGGSGGSGGVTWESVFADRLREWRKVRYESTIRRHDYVRDSQ